MNGMDGKKLDVNVLNIYEWPRPFIYLDAVGQSWSFSAWSKQESWCFLHTGILVGNQQARTGRRCVVCVFVLFGQAAGCRFYFENKYEAVTHHHQTLVAGRVALFLTANNGKHTVRSLVGPQFIYKYIYIFIVSSMPAFFHRQTTTRGSYASVPGRGTFFA
jgi:hypothetical protein